jgi:hypothetical protein
MRKNKILMTAVLIITILAVLPLSSVNAANSGPEYAGTGADGGGTGTAWTVPEKTATDDTAYAYVTLANSTTISDYLWANNFGISIPTDATIRGSCLIRYWRMSPLNLFSALARRW